MPHIKDIKKKILSTGIVGQYVHGNNLTTGWVTIEKGSRLGLHHHPHEQITIMLEGSMEMQIGSELVLLEKGMVQVIPPDVPHSAVAHEDCILIDVFNPVREDYKEA
ncbi:MAG: cupin domain-containing protein [Bacteroidota bacterium]|jgi:quercetin dioxygenase-like cupin family protein